MDSTLSPSASDGLSIARLEYLAKLPLLLNSSLEFKSIVSNALEHLKKFLNAEAATVFLGNNEDEALRFWALRGDRAKNLEGKQMPSRKGIVGWAIERQEAIFIADAKNDPRFFREVDLELDFETRDLICVPLTARGMRKLGALQVLNSAAGGFSPSDVEFVVRFAGQLALALDNALMHQSLREQNTKLGILNRRKDEVISVIAHEFRTPLSIINSSAELIALGRVKENSLSKVVSALQNGVQRLTRLVGEVKNISCVQSANLTLKLAPVRVAEIFSSIESQFLPTAVERQIKLSLTISENADYVLADHALILIALRNLISNAFRATRDNGEITLQASHSCALVTFSVADTGIGIAPDQLSLIFEKFYEVADSKEHSTGSLGFRACGLGLGLATAQSILEAHRTKLEVSSTLGKGSCFSFALEAVTTQESSD